MKAGKGQSEEQSDPRELLGSSDMLVGQMGEDMGGLKVQPGAAQEDHGYQTVRAMEAERSPGDRSHLAVESFGANV